MKRGAGLITAAAILVMLAGGFFALRPYVFRETLALALLLHGDAPYPRAVEAGVDLALREREGRAGRYRIRAGRFEGSGANSPDLDVPAPFRVGPDRLEVVAVIECGAPWWSFATIRSRGPVIVSADSSFYCWNESDPGDPQRPDGRIMPSCLRLGDAAVEWTKRLGATRVFLLEEMFDRRAGGIADAFRQAAKKSGLQLAGEVRYSEPYTSLPDEVVEATPSAVFLSGESRANANEIFSRLRERGYRGPLMLADHDPTASLLLYPPLEVEGCRLVSLIRPPPPEFTNRHGATAIGVWQGYEAAKAALDAIEQAGSKDGKAILRALADHPAFQANGDPASPVVAGYTLKNGAWVFTEALK